MTSATPQNRQVAVKAIAPKVDLMIVVGSQNSSNSVRLVEVALQNGAKDAHLVDYAEQVKPEWFEGVENVGVTSGASVPEILVRGVLELLAERGIGLVVLAGFLRILSPEFVSGWAGRMLNIHPSLIPAFCGEGYYGLRVHEAALRRGVKLTGATVHFVNEIPDGGEIILQQAVPVLPGDTPESLQRRVMEQAEWKLLPEAVERVARDIERSEKA